MGIGRRREQLPAQPQARDSGRTIAQRPYAHSSTGQDGAAPDSARRATSTTVEANPPSRQAPRWLTTVQASAPPPIRYGRILVSAAVGNVNTTSAVPLMSCSLPAGRPDLAFSSWYCPSIWKPTGLAAGLNCTSAKPCQPVLTKSLVEPSGIVAP